MSTKEILLEVAAKLPPDATLVDAIYELEFRQAVQQGLLAPSRTGFWIGNNRQAVTVWP